MEAYKFETTIQKDGVIQIPEIAELVHQRVEVFVVINPTDQEETTKQPSQSMKAFLNKWRGVLRDSDPDELKSRYLQEKYR